MMRELTFMQTIFSGKKISLSTINNKKLSQDHTLNFCFRIPHVWDSILRVFSGYNVLLVYVHKSFKISLESAGFSCETEAC